MTSWKWIDDLHKRLGRAEHIGRVHPRGPDGPGKLRSASVEYEPKQRREVSRVGSTAVVAPEETAWKETDPTRRYGA